MLTRPSGLFCYYHWLLKSRTMTVEVKLMMEKNGKKKKKKHQAEDEHSCAPPYHRCVKLAKLLR